MDKISSVEAKNYINSLPKMEKKKFNEVFAGANPVAIDLLEAMLEIDPDRRITAEQTLAHPYLAQVTSVVIHCCVCLSVCLSDPGTPLPGPGDIC